MANTDEPTQRQQLILAAIILAVIAVVAGLGTLLYVSSTPHNPVATIVKPIGWTKVNPTPAGALVSYNAPTAEADATGKLTPYIYAQSYTVGSGQKLTTSQLAKKYVTQLAAHNTDYKQLAIKPVTIDKTPAVLVTYSSSVESTAITTDSLFMIKNGVAYSINGESLASTWAQNSAAIQKSLLTFHP